MVKKKIKPKFSKKFWIILGYISTCVGLFAIALSLGQHFGYSSGYSQARRDEFKIFIDYLAELRNNVRISSLVLDRKTAKPGETCELTLEVQNQCSYECNLWVGVSAVSPDKREFWNVSEDCQAKISDSGLTSLKRHFTFPDDAPLGIYDFKVNLWYGNLGDPAHSERISSATMNGQLNLVRNDSPSNNLPQSKTTPAIPK